MQQERTGKPSVGTLVEPWKTREHVKARDPLQEVLHAGSPLVSSKAHARGAQSLTAYYLGHGRLCCNGACLQFDTTRGWQERGTKLV